MSIDLKLNIFENLLFCRFVCFHQTCSSRLKKLSVRLSVIQSSNIHPMKFTQRTKSTFYSLQCRIWLLEFVFSARCFFVVFTALLVSFVLDMINCKTISVWKRSVAVCQQRYFILRFKVNTHLSWLTCADRGEGVYALLRR